MTLLLTLLVKSLLVFALAGAALGVLRRASAAARHLVCLLTLAAMLALPLFSVLLPGWHLRVLEPTPARSSLSPPETGRVGVGAGLASGLKASPVLETPHASETPDVPEPLRPPILGGPLRSHLLQSKEVGFLTLYLLGCLLASLRPLLGLWGIARLDHQCTDITDPPTLTAAAHCAETLHLRTPCLCRGDVSVPMTWGWRHPIILLSKESVEWPQDKLQSVLLHEMAHIKRHDWLSHRLADFVCAVYWFHPLVWLTARRLRTESELACDDLVLTSGIAASEYARHLLEIARALGPTFSNSQTAIAMAQTSRIERRLKMILDKTQSRRILTRRALLLALIPSAATLMTLAALRPSVRAEAASTRHSITSMETIGKPLLAGITDGNRPGSSWWSRSGTHVPAPFYNKAIHPLGVVGAKGTRSLIFAFRFPRAERNLTTMLEAPNCIISSSAGTWTSKVLGQANLPEASLNRGTGGVRILEALYPASAIKGIVKVGYASGPWTTSVHYLPPVPDSGSGSTSPDGTFIFSPITQTKDGLTLTIATNAASRYDQQSDLRVTAIDASGHELLPETIGDNSNGPLDLITAHFTERLSHIKDIRVQTRPFQWIEFKDVALQPVK